MKHNLKKCISLLLVLVMLMGMTPTVAFASDGFARRGRNGGAGFALHIPLQRGGRGGAGI